ncbi:MAG: phosphoenolpyruvate--protein phosphotransferase [candidate division Zixibacteria bacterium]|nr:phosphoenolpyruvate--protein phosphotransferase [candidate division Zixibacteria bacterium]MDH3936715.1 phosphoenolpyruvate--protein phosphotransferase [candidate division Zixibacteria bacterium]MDH4032568.1 phosphoenolpyruvate--protein phosphotransferase [candidate division Zixibacteria bacterium]
MTAKRRILSGLSISGGIVLGQARVILPGEVQVAEIAVPTSRLKHETESLDRAVEQALRELRQLRTSAGTKMEGPVAKVFDAQLLIAGDYEFLKKVKEEIHLQKRNAAYVYDQLVKLTMAPLTKSSDFYMRQMGEDIKSVAARVLSYLSGFEKSESKLPPGTILVGKTFTPGDVLLFRQRKATGFLISKGGPDSHMALIARSLMLPVVLVEGSFLEVANNSRLILNGTAGEVIINPTDEDWVEYQKLKKRHGPALVTRIRRLTQVPPITRDGVEVSIAGNLSLSGPVDDILAERAFPIGLYRTEFLFLDDNRFPDEEAQFEPYKQIVQKFAGQPVVLRMFDLGYDKIRQDAAWPVEMNPALGWRGIRVMLDRTAIFKTQVRAILRASAFGKVKIMLPMVTVLSEVERARKLISQVKLGLRRKGVAFDETVQVGIMVEVPAAALTAHALAAKVDFMSIGSNDLTQYTMATDRMNNRVADLYTPYHPAVLNLIHKTVEAGKACGKPVSICGEVAGDQLALPLFIGMGVDQLSMNPNRIFDICRLVKRIDSRLVRHLVAPVLAAGSEPAVKQILENFKSESQKTKLQA